MGCLGPQSRVQLVQHLIALLTPVIYGAGCHSISESVSPHRTFFKNTSLQETPPCLFDSESIQSWSKAKRQAHSEWRRTSQETQQVRSLPSCSQPLKSLHIKSHSSTLTWHSNSFVRVMKLHHTSSSFQHFLAPGTDTFIQQYPAFQLSGVQSRYVHKSAR